METTGIKTVTKNADYELGLCDAQDLVEIFSQAAKGFDYEFVDVEVAPLPDLKVKWMRTPALIHMEVSDYLLGVQRRLVSGLAVELLARINYGAVASDAVDEVRRACCTPEFAARWQETWAERKGYRPVEGVEVPEDAPEGTGLYLGPSVDEALLMRAVVIPAWLPADEVGAAVAAGVESLKEKMAAVMEGSDRAGPRPAHHGS